MEMTKVTLHTRQHKWYPNSHHTSHFGQHSPPFQKHSLVAVLTRFLFPLQYKEFETDPYLFLNFYRCTVHLEESLSITHQRMH